jgi:lactoylglutathione lyase
MGLDLISAHVGIVVRDLCRSTDFYCHVLGGKVKAIYDDAHSPVRRVLLDVAGQPLELLQYMDERATQVRTAGSIDHVAFRVTDMDKAVSILQNLHVNCVDEAPRRVSEITRIFFFLGPDGERIEFIEDN